MIHPNTRLATIDGVVGQGLVATRPIPLGTITWVLDDLDRVFTAPEIAALPTCYEPMIDQWTFDDGHGRHVLCWDIGRFMNHSCECNCAGSELGFEVALRDIDPGEQLTNDYEVFVLESREWFECRCGAPPCRGVVAQGRSPSVVEAVLLRVRLAIPAVDRVAQPLLPLMRPHQLAAAVTHLGGDGEVPEIG